MTPTPKLRWINRPLPNTTSHVERVLQQWWENKNIVLAIHVEDKDGNPLPPPTHGEWRDVPLEAA
jgi:hypothetical protein